MSEPVTIPSDVDREDRILGNFTARQVLIAAMAGLGLYAGWWLLRGLLPGLVYAALALPVGVVVLVGITARRDGLPLERWVRAAIAHRLRPKRRIAHPQSAPAAPPWLAQAAAGETQPPTTRLELPPEGVDEAGVIDLGRDGLAMLASCAPVNFTLRTPDEQRALTNAFARYLHGLSSPVHILVRAHRWDVSEQADQLRENAQHLPHPALAAAAADHADYLEQLANQTELLRRHILLIAREAPTHAAGGASTTNPTEGHTSESDRQAACARLTRRLREASETLGPAGVTVTPLTAAQARAVLAAATQLDTPTAAHPDTAGAGEIITAPDTWQGD